MREIAQAAGVGKSTLYDYFKSKDEILVSYFEDVINELTEKANLIVAQNLGVTKKLRKLMEEHLMYLVDSKSFYLMLSLEVQTLSLGSQKKIQVQRYAYQDIFRDVIVEGINTGIYRPVNPLFAARSIFQLLSLAVFTSRPDAIGDPKEMMDEAMSIFFEGIQA
jgi:AcrR family transcriptional regulator